MRTRTLLGYILPIDFEGSLNVLDDQKSKLHVLCVWVRVSHVEIETLMESCSITVCALTFADMRGMERTGRRKEVRDIRCCARNISARVIENGVRRNMVQCFTP